MKNVTKPQIISTGLALILRMHGLTVDDVTPEQLAIWEDELDEKMKGEKA